MLAHGREPQLSVVMGATPVAQVSSLVCEQIGRDLRTGAFGVRAAHADVCALEGDCWFGPVPQCCPSCRPCMGEDVSASCPPAMFLGFQGPGQWDTAVCQTTPVELPGRAPQWHLWLALGVSWLSVGEPRAEVTPGVSLPGFVGV